MAGWSERDRRVVVAIAEALAPAPRTTLDRQAGLALEAIDRALDPGQVRQLRLALRLLDSGLVNRAFGGPATGIASQSRDERERTLLDWGRSRLGLRRSAFQAWRRLLLFLAYADPEPEPGTRNRRWAAIGYEPERAPLAAEPTPIRPLELPRGPLPVEGMSGGGSGRAVELEADVAIVGSGAGGGVVAAELARAGRSVVVLEAGPFVPEPEMPSDEMTAFDRLYLDHGLCTSADGSVAILAGATVGGGTTVNWTTSIAVTDEVRSEWAREHGLDGIDGPETHADLDVLERELGFAAPAVMPEKDGAILRGAEVLGREAAPTRRDADACSQCGSCGFGCRQGTKRSGLRAHLADAYGNGARIVADARVTRVIVERGRAAGVEAVVGAADRQPVRLVVHARQVVVAAGALRTPVVLAQSRISHPAVGRYLRLHPVSVIAAEYPEPVEMWCGPLQAARSLEFLRSGARGRGFVVESAPGHPGLMALAFPWESTADHEAMMRSSRFTAPMIAIARDRGSGVVRPLPGGRARIDYRVTPGDAVTLRRGLVEMARLARAAGAIRIVALGMPSERIQIAAAGDSSAASDHSYAASDHSFDAFLDRLARFDFSPNRGMVFSAHQMGSARMGAAATDHVCDPAGRVRADGSGRIVPGLYVADASLFPTAIGVNPMVTVMLLARRVSRTVLAE